MRPIVAVALGIVTLALVCYTIGTAVHQRTRRVTPVALRFLTLGVLFDVLSTSCMMVAAGRIGFTPHALLGYTALSAMLVETGLAWRHRRAHGDSVPVSAGMGLYSRLAYAYWVIAFVSGGIMVAMSRRAGRQAALLAAVYLV
jgi:hypothetical protein